MQRILAVARDYDAADRFRAALVEGAASQCRTERHVRDVLDANRHALVGLDHRFFDVFRALDPTEASNEVLDAVDLDHARANFEVRTAHGLEHLVELHAVSPHRSGIDIDLVLANETADRSHFRDALRRHQRIADVPVLRAAQLVEVPATRRIALFVASLERVPEHLPKRSRVRAERGSDSFRQRPRWQAA